MIEEEIEEDLEIEEAQEEDIAIEVIETSIEGVMIEAGIDPKVASTVMRLVTSPVIALSVKIIITLARQPR